MSKNHKKKRSRRTRKSQNRANKSFLLEHLEERQLLDAGGFAEIVQATSLESESIDIELASPTDAVLASEAEVEAKSTALIFVDAGVEDS